MMSGDEIVGRREVEDASQAFGILTDRLNAFAAACASASEPPSISDFLPDGPRSLRRIALVELVKIDLEHRWRRGLGARNLDDYARQFPELREVGTIPCELIYEEFHVRRRSGETLDYQSYAARFPEQAEQLAKMLNGVAPQRTSALYRPESTLSAEVGDTIDDFDLLARLGRGAFATVFLARQRSMQRLVALKISADHGVEAQTLAQFDHPNVVRVYDQRLDAERGNRLLYMQYLAGGTLQGVIEAVRRTRPAERRGGVLIEAIDRALDERGETPPTDSHQRARLAAASWPAVVCWIGARLAMALDYAHRHGVLHRDINRPMFY